MSKKNKADQRGFVYSTDPDFRFEELQEEQSTLPPAQQRLRVRLETKHRAGKMVTLVEGFAGTAADAAQLGKELKNVCGSGGAVKDMEILVQGDHRDKVLQYLLKKGYSQARKI